MGSLGNRRQILQSIKQTNYPKCCPNKLLGQPLTTEVKIDIDYLSLPTAALRHGVSGLRRQNESETHTAQPNQYFEADYLTFLAR